MSGTCGDVNGSLLARLQPVHASKTRDSPQGVSLDEEWTTSILILIPAAGKFGPIYCEVERYRSVDLSQTESSASRTSEVSLSRLGSLEQRCHLRSPPSADRYSNSVFQDQ